MESLSRFHLQKCSYQNSILLYILTLVYPNYKSPTTIDNKAGHADHDFLELFFSLLKKGSFPLVFQLQKRLLLLASIIVDGFYATSIIDHSIAIFL
jgi:hypothetical protein